VELFSGKLADENANETARPMKFVVEMRYARLPGRAHDSLQRLAHIPFFRNACAIHHHVNFVQSAATSYASRATFETTTFHAKWRFAPRFRCRLQSTARVVVIAGNALLRFPFPRAMVTSRRFRTGLAK